MAVKKKAGAKKKAAKRKSAAKKSLLKNVKRKTAKPVFLIYQAKKTSMAGIPAAGQKIMMDLYKYIEKYRIRMAGAPVWSYQGLPKGKLILKAGYAVKPGSPARRPYEAGKEPAWKCLSGVYKGSMADIKTAWDELWTALARKGLQSDGSCREIYTKWIDPESKANVTELQIRLL